MNTVTAHADYKVTLASAPPAGPERSAALSGCHERGAERLLQLCFKNGGIYTKLGAWPHTAAAAAGLPRLRTPP